jgi:hypothetical protein
MHLKGIAFEKGELIELARILSICEIKCTEPLDSANVVLCTLRDTNIVPSLLSHHHSLVFRVI